MADFEGNLVRRTRGNLLLSYDPSRSGAFWSASRLCFNDNTVPSNRTTVLRVAGNAGRDGEQERRVGGGGRKPDHVPNDVPLRNLLPCQFDANVSAEHCSRVAVVLLD